MVHMNDSLSNAILYGNKGKIEKWIHDFLCGKGGNKPFSDGLKLFKRHFIGPIKVSLNNFKRCCGPEDNMKYIIDKDRFEHIVSKMINEIKNGWDMPPLIINYSNGVFELNDGNHRYEALKRSEITEYYAIIWITDEEDLHSFKEYYLDNLCD